MVSYRVTILPNEHALAVEMTVDQGKELILEIPTWVPGAYGFMRYARDVVDVKAFDASTDAALIVQREGMSAFRVEGAGVDSGGRRTRITYKAFVVDPAWGELGGVVGTDQAVLLGTRLFFVRGQDGPCRVIYEVPEKWGFHHPAGATAIDARTFEYPNYATLLDTPVVCGRFDDIERDVEGTPFHFIFLERAIGFEQKANELVDALVKVAKECKMIFGAFPFESYAFVMSTDPRAHWGLEHENATMIGIGEDAFIDPEARLQAVRVAGHELLHAWNVKRLKPKPIARLNLTEGSFTDALWVAEGFTRYYEFLLAVRVGEMSAARFFSNVVNYWRHLAMRPAYARASAADSSRATFLSHHRYPGAWNSSIDYYDAGMLVAFDVDAVLRRAAAPSTLDTAFAAFYDQFVATGFTGKDAQEFFAQRDPSLAALLAREVEGAGGLSTVEQLEALGFEVTTSDAPRLGIVLEKKTGPKIGDVLEGSAAAKAGLAPDDEIVKLEGSGFHRRGLEWLVANRERFSIEVKRGAKFFLFDVEPLLRADVVGLTWNGDEAALARLKKWLGRADLAWAPGTAISLADYDNFHGTDAPV
ncbi:MAG: hypothetical protein ABI551_15480 [Polyangiaceae bacterium]